MNQVQVCVENCRQLPSTRAVKKRNASGQEQKHKRNHMWHATQMTGTHM